MNDFDKEELYQLSVEMMECSMSDKDALIKTAEAFESLGDYKDSVQLAWKCRETVTSIEKKTADSEECKDTTEETQSKTGIKERITKKEVLLISAVAVCVFFGIIIVAFVANNNSSKSRKSATNYKKASEETSWVYSSVNTTITSSGELSPEKNKTNNSNENSTKNGAGEKSYGFDDSSYENDQNEYDGTIADNSDKGYKGDNLSTEEITSHIHSDSCKKWVVDTPYSPAEYEEEPIYEIDYEYKIIVFKTEEYLYFDSTEEYESWKKSNPDSSHDVVKKSSYQTIVGYKDVLVRPEQEEEGHWEYVCGY